MNNLRCYQCGLVNWTAATICKRCDTPLAAESSGLFTPLEISSPRLCAANEGPVEPSSYNDTFSGFSTVLGLFGLILFGLCLVLGLFLESPFCFYIAGKYALYSGWCYLGFRCFRFTRAASASVAFGVSLGLGFIRVILGPPATVAFFLFSQALVGLFFSSAGEHATPNPISMVLLPLRFAEWLLIAKLMSNTKPHALNKWLWILGGILLSWVADAILFNYAMPELKWGC